MTRMKYAANSVAHSDGVCPRSTNSPAQKQFGMNEGKGINTDGSYQFLEYSLVQIFVRLMECVF